MITAVLTLERRLIHEEATDVAAAYFELLELAPWGSQLEQRLVRRLAEALAVATLSEDLDVDLDPSVLEYLAGVLRCLTHPTPKEIQQ